MALGFLYAVLTGLSWTVIGAVLSGGANNRFDLVAYSVIQTAATGVLALLFYARPSGAAAEGMLLPALAVFVAGAVNAIGQLVVKTAMTRGNHGPVWAVSQSALVIPFLAGVMFWGNPGTAGQWIGTALITGGILIPAAGKFRDCRVWLGPAVAALLLFGVVQTLYALPSQLAGGRDPGGLRPMLAAFGGTAGWLPVLLLRRKFSPDRRTLILALGMSVLSLVSLKLFFLSLDRLARAGLGSVGIPLVVGCNIAGFFLYSLLVLRERPGRIEISGMLALLAGIAAIAIN